MLNSIMRVQCAAMRQRLCWIISGTLGRSMLNRLRVAWIAIVVLLLGGQPDAQQEEAAARLVEREDGEMIAAAIPSDDDRTREFSFHCFADGRWRMMVLNLAGGVQPVPANGAEVEVGIYVPVGGILGQMPISRSTWHWLRNGEAVTQHPDGTGARLSDPSREAEMVLTHMLESDRMRVEIGDLPKLEFDMAAARPILLELESRCEAFGQADGAPLKQETPVAESDAGGSESDPKPRVRSESADEAEQRSIGEQLIEASSRGDVRTVRAMAEANAYVPTSGNALKARVRAKANGHRKVVAILDGELDEYFKSGAAYASAAESLLEKTREALQEDPEYLESFKWRLSLRMNKSFYTGFYRKAGKDPKNPLYPLAVRFDHDKYARYIDTEVEKLAEELLRDN